jgi:hypothetical protein
MSIIFMMIVLRARKSNNPSQKQQEVHKAQEGMPQSRHKLTAGTKKVRRASPGEPFLARLFGKRNS